MTVAEAVALLATAMAADAAFTAAFEPLGGRDRLTAGEDNMPRDLATTNATVATSGTLRGRFFTARTASALTQVRMYSGATAAGATPTLIRVGVWAATAAGVLTSLEASTANDTSLLAVANTAYTKSLQASWTPTRGQRYFAALLVVTAATAPTMQGSQTTGSPLALGESPVLAGFLSGQTDLPSTATVSSLTGQVPYLMFLP